MRGGVTNRRKSTKARRASELVPGDIIVIDGGRVEVLSEPLLGRSGASVFDVPKLFWLVRVRPFAVSASSACYVRWEIDERVEVAQRGSRPTRPRPAADKSKSRNGG